MANSSSDRKDKKKSALVCYKNRQYEEAISLYRQVCESDESDVEALSMLGLIHANMERYKDAEGFFRKLVRLKPKSVDYNYNLARALELQGQYEESCQYYQAALKYSKNKHPQAHNNLGNIYKEQKSYDKAIQHYEQALRLEPNNYKVHNNLGNLLIELGKFKDAERHLKKAIAAKSDYAEAHYNLGILYKTTGDIENALKEYDRALQLDPHSAQTHWNRAFVLLSSGDFEQGWQEYEWRFAAGIAPYRNFTKPKWQGEPLSGKILYVYAEQGIGDMFQFIRYLSLIKKPDNKIIFECQPGLADVLQSVENIDQLTDNSSSAQALQYDYHVSLLDLPGLLKTRLDNIPADIPYISADPDRVQAWRGRMNHTGFKVGIVWAGNREHKNDRNRSCSLTLFYPLLRCPGAVFYSLQKGDSVTELLNVPDDIKIIDLNPEIQSFVDTAAIIANLDLVISVDTAAAHLAGAMGKTVWTLIPFDFDWRWLTKRDDSPWYPSMRLFRQPDIGDWESVFSSVADELRKLTAQQG